MPSQRKQKNPQKKPAGSPPPPPQRMDKPTARKRKSLRQRRGCPPRVRELIIQRRIRRIVSLFQSKFSLFLLIREVILECSNGEPFLWQSKAVEALLESSELFLRMLHETAYAFALRDKRVTLSVEDIQSVVKEWNLKSLPC